MPRRQAAPYAGSERRVSRDTGAEVRSSSGSRLARIAEWTRLRERLLPMQKLFEITFDGDISDDWETHPLFVYDPESLGDDPIE